MLQVRKLTLHHLKDLKEIVKGLSFTINPGDKVAIIGTFIEFTSQNPAEDRDYQAKRRREKYLVETIVDRAS